MSKKEKYHEAKRLLEEIHYELATQPLTVEQRATISRAGLPDYLTGEVRSYL